MIPVNEEGWSIISAGKIIELFAINKSYPVENVFGLASSDGTYFVDTKTDTEIWLYKVYPYTALPYRVKLQKLEFMAYGYIEIVADTAGEVDIRSMSPLVARFTTLYRLSKVFYRGQQAGTLGGGAFTFSLDKLFSQAINTSGVTGKLSKMVAENTPKKAMPVLMTTARKRRLRALKKKKPAGKKLKWGYQSVPSIDAILNDTFDGTASIPHATFVGAQQPPNPVSFAEWGVPVLTPGSVFATTTSSMDDISGISARFISGTESYFTTNTVLDNIPNNRVVEVVSALTAARLAAGSSFSSEGLSTYSVVLIPVSSSPGGIWERYVEDYVRFWGTNVYHHTNGRNYSTYVIYIKRGVDLFQYGNSDQY